MAIDVVVVVDFDFVVVVGLIRLELRCCGGTRFVGIISWFEFLHVAKKGFWSFRVERFIRDCFDGGKKFTFSTFVVSVVTLLTFVVVCIVVCLLGSIVGRSWLCCWFRIIVILLSLVSGCVIGS